MANKEIETLDQYLNRELKEQKIEKTHVLPVKSTKTNKKNNKKKGVVALVALVAAGAIALTSGILSIFPKSNKDKSEKNTKKTSTSISTMSIDDMGVELEIPKKAKPKYGKTTGNVDVNKIVEKDGVIYVDKESADKSDQVGNSSIDTKSDTLKVDSDGKVKVKEKGYEIKDGKTGSTISTGNLDDTGIPEDYEYNKELDGIYEKEDKTDDLVYADSNYYSKDGTLIIKKGDIVTKDTLEEAKKTLLTKKPTSSSSTSSNESNNSSNNTSNNSSSNESSNSSTTQEDGKVNKDGTYTIYGLTFKSKSDYEKWLAQGAEGYVELDGIMVPENDLHKVSKNQSSNTNTSNNTSNNTSSNGSNNSSTSDKGVVNEDGTYTIEGITYLSKADYQQCIIDNYEGYALIDGIMQPMDQYQEQLQKVK